MSHFVTRKKIPGKMEYITKNGALHLHIASFFLSFIEILTFFFFFIYLKQLLTTYYIKSVFSIHSSASFLSRQEILPLKPNKLSIS